MIRCRLNLPRRQRCHLRPIHGRAQGCHALRNNLITATNCCHERTSLPRTGFTLETVQQSEQLFFVCCRFLIVTAARARAMCDARRAEGFIVLFAKFT